MSVKKTSGRNSKGRKKKKSGNCSGKNGPKSSCGTKGLLNRNPKSSNSKAKSGQFRKITDERKPFIFERVMAGVACTVIAEEFGEEYEFSIDQSSINHFLRDHPEEYKAWRDRNFKEDVRLADRKARLVALQRKTDLLGRKIDEILKQVTKRQYRECGLTLLLREYREYIIQIRDESGDKPANGKEQGDGKGATVIQIVNTIPGMYSNGDGSDASEESSTTRSGFRMDRL